MANGEIDIIAFLFPILCCLTAIILERQARSAPQSEPFFDELWFTNLNIEEAYKSIVKEVDGWRDSLKKRQESNKSLISRARGRGNRERFIVKQDVPPKLYRIFDEQMGDIYFELIEVEEGGTVVKATYKSPKVKELIASFKAKQPTKIPAAPIGKRCPACGKPVLPEFKLCPYCGQKLIED
jgi:hypothetical protein